MADERAEVDPPDRFWMQESLGLQTTVCYPSMKWGTHVDLSKCIVEGAPFGGPIAVAPDPTKIGAFATRTGVDIYTSAGEHLVYCDTQTSAPIHTMGWSDDLVLSIMFTDSTLQRWTMKPNTPPETRDLMQLDNQEICLVSFFPKGMVCVFKESQVLQEKYRLFALSFAGGGDQNGVLHDVALDALPAPPEALAVEVDGFDLSFFVSAGNSLNRIYRIGEKYNLNDYDLSALGEQKVLKMTVSPNQQSIALFNETGKIVIATFDPTNANVLQLHREYNPRTKMVPRQLVWCGNDAVVATWPPEATKHRASDDYVVFVCGVAHNTKWDHSPRFDGPVYMIAECDCIRVITNAACTMFNLMPGSVNRTFGIASGDPPAELLDAYRDCENHKSDSIELMQDLISRDNLREAIEELIDAAGHEWVLSGENSQQELMKAASYGRSFYEGRGMCELAERYANQCKILRVLVRVRAPDVGMPLTLAQYKELGKSLLIERLVQRGFYFLAYRISEYIDEDPKYVLIKWACEKVASVRGKKGRGADPSSTDDAVVAAITEKFQDQPGISYLDVVKAALRPKENPNIYLAAKLLEHEPSAEQQLQNLVEMWEQFKDPAFRQKALAQAVDSHDMVLLFWVVTKLMTQALNTNNKAERGNMFNMIGALPAAESVFVTYYEHHERPVVSQYYDSQNQVQRKAYMSLMDYCKVRDEAPDDPNKQDRKLKDFMELVGKQTLEGELAVQQQKLVDKQRKYHQEIKGFPKNLSAAATIRELISHQKYDKAEELKKHLKMNDKMFHWAKLKALCEFGQWNELDNFAKPKKNPIGFQPFVKECMRVGNVEKAKLFVHRIEDHVEKCESLCALEMWRDAADLAVKYGEYELLAEGIMRECPIDSPDYSYVAEAEQRLRGS